MARRSGLGIFVKTVIKISREIDRESRRREREAARAKRESDREARNYLRQRNRELKARAREDREALRENAQELKRQMRAESKSARAAKKAQKERSKAAKEAQREREEYLDRISEELDPMTESEFGLGKMAKREKTKIDNWSLAIDLGYLKRTKRPFVGKLGLLRVDQILLSGSFNSVVGIEGLLAFRKAIESLKIGYDDKNSIQDIQVFLDYVFVALVQTGTYLVLDGAPGRDQDGWVTAFRYILINENSINSSETRGEVEAAFSVFEIPADATGLFRQEDVIELNRNLAMFAQKTIDMIKKHLADTNMRRLLAKGA